LQKEKNREQHYVRATGSTQQSDQVGYASHGGATSQDFSTRAGFKPI